MVLTGNSPAMFSQVIIETMLFVSITLDHSKPHAVNSRVETLSKITPLRPFHCLVWGRAVKDICPEVSFVDQATISRTIKFAIQGLPHLMHMVLSFAAAAWDVRLF